MKVVEQSSPVRVVEQNSPMRVVEQKSPASSQHPPSSQPSESATCGEFMDLDLPGNDSMVGNESTWSVHANPGGCKYCRH